MISSTLMPEKISTYTHRLATVDDAAEIAPLWQAFAQERVAADPSMKIQPDFDFQHYILRQLELPLSFGWVLEHHSEENTSDEKTSIVGCIFVYFYDEAPPAGLPQEMLVEHELDNPFKPRRVGSVLGMYVQPEHRDSDNIKRLAHTAIQQAIDMQVSDIDILVCAEQTGIQALLQRAGFTKAAVQYTKHFEVANYPELASLHPPQIGFWQADCNFIDRKLVEYMPITPEKKQELYSAYFCGIIDRNDRLIYAKNQEKIDSNFYLSIETKKTAFPDIFYRLLKQLKQLKKILNFTEKLEIEQTTDISEKSNINLDIPLKPIFESGTFTVDDTGEVSIDYVFDGGGYKGQLAIFSLEGLEAFELGSFEFIQEVTRRALSGSEEGHIVISDRTGVAKFTGNLGDGNQNSGIYQGVQTFAMRPGDTFGVMLVPNGTVQQVFDNPEIGGAKRPLFSLTTANPNDGCHLGQIADVTGDRNTFVLEHLRVDYSSNRDYNDIIFQIRGARPRDAVLLDYVIKEDKDWRTSELAQGIFSYVIGGLATETETEETSDIDNSEEEETETTIAEQIEQIIKCLDLLVTLADVIGGLATETETEETSDIDNSEEEETETTIAEQIEQAIESSDRLLTLADTDSELSDRDRTALEYARQNQLILVVNAGKEADKISPLGRASLEFDNIITVETANGEASSVNSGSSEGLNILATGNVSEVGDAVSQILEGNTRLSLSQVVEAIELTATDVETPNWDEQTGSGLLNTQAAVHFAKTIKAESVGVINSLYSDELSAHLYPAAPQVVRPISNLTLNPQENSARVDLSSGFFAANDETFTYESISPNSAALEVNLEETNLQLNAGNVTANTPVTVRATDPSPSGNVAIHTFSVTKNTLTSEKFYSFDSALPDVNAAINFDNSIASLDSKTTEKKFVSMQELLQTGEMLLDYPKLVRLGVSVPWFEVFNDPNSEIWDNSLINAADAFSLLPDNAPQPQVGIIDFSGKHGEQVTDIFESVNPIVQAKLYDINNRNWSELLVKFVDKVKASGESQGIVNLSFDLTQVDADGQITTRYELTPQEQLALQYARENNVLIVAASGNTGDMMSALGQAAEKFDNIITVGAVNKWEEAADYSSRGDTLTLVAPGGEYENDRDAFVGTSKATSYVTGAASLVWAANPELSYQQVKEILTATAKDLGPVGWDEDTGAGLINVTEAVMMAGFLMPQDLADVDRIDIEAFAGEGPVKTLARAASPETEEAIAHLTETQNSLNNQWQVLKDLGNPDLTLEELQTEIATRKSAALDSYQEADVAAAKSLLETQQLSEALTLAIAHHQIESARLQTLQGRQQQLQQGLETLTGERDELAAANAEQLQALEDAIARTEEELADARAKLQYQLVDPDTLVANADAVKAEIAQLEEKIKEYRQQSAALKAQADSHYAQAAQYRQQQQHHTNIANNAWTTRRGRSGRRHRTRNMPVYNHHMNLANQARRNATQASSQGDLFQADRSKLEQLAAQMDQQNQALKDYEKLLESNNRELSKLTGESDDAQEILEALQKQAAQKTQHAQEYWQQAELAEKRRVENQGKADWHNSMINRHEVVGYRRTGRSGKKRKPIYGRRHYPEHIAPRDPAQQQANAAEQERRVLEQWAQQAQTKADISQQQATALGERLQDWPELKQGIEHEIHAKEQQLQGEKDLLALQTPMQRQQLETLELQIAGSEAEL